jgi:ribosomal-protein-alanine N-acetyltransferase
VLELQRLRPDHEAAILAFERANRAYFAESINDRDDDFYEQFPERHGALLAEQGAGIGVFHVLVDEDARILVRTPPARALTRALAIGLSTSCRGFPCAA